MDTKFQDLLLKFIFNRWFRSDLRKESRYPDLLRKDPELSSKLPLRPHTHDRRHSRSPQRREDPPPRRMDPPPRRMDSPSRRLDSPPSRPSTPPLRKDSLSRPAESPPRRLLSPPRDLGSPPSAPKFIDSFGPVPSRSSRDDTEARNSKLKEERLKMIASNTSSSNSRYI